MTLGLQLELEKANKRKEELKSFCNENLANVDNIVLEIGCGHGHYLTAYADQHKDEVCVGIDILIGRILKGQKKQSQGELKNLHFIRIEANEFLEALPERIKLSKVFVLFPDPWPKNKHHKNRLFQKEFLDLLASRCDKGVALCFRTDHEAYFAWTKKFIMKNENWKILEDAQWPFEKESIFQQKMRTYQSLIAERV